MLSLDKPLHHDSWLWHNDARVLCATVRQPSKFVVARISFGSEVVAPAKPHEPDDSCAAAEETRTSDGSEVLSALEDLEAPAEVEEAMFGLH